MLLKILIDKPYILIASLLCLAIVSCKDFEDCRSLYTSQVNISLEPYDTNNPQPIQIDPIASDYVNPLTVKSFILALNPAANMSSFRFYGPPPASNVDTLILFYKRIPLLLSPACGVEQMYILDSVQTTFYKAEIINKFPLTKEGKGKIDVKVFY